MTFQRELNSYIHNIYLSVTQVSEYSFIITLYIVSLIAFSGYGWVCIADKNTSDSVMCVISFIMGINLEINFVVFIIIPASMCLIVNCIFPIRPTPPLQAAPVTPYTSLSYSELYRLQRYIEGHPQIIRGHA
jgi:hypothetical protein